jgi:hypothetical protein
MMCYSRRPRLLGPNENISKLYITSYSLVTHWNNKWNKIRLKKKKIDSNREKNDLSLILQEKKIDIAILV